jgi:hypothetical protein
MLRPSMLFTSMSVLVALTVARGQQVTFDNVDGVIVAQKPCVLSPYEEPIVYANDIHEAANNRRDRDARIVVWFKRYIR